MRRANARDVDAALVFAAAALTGSVVAVHAAPAGVGLAALLLVAVCDTGRGKRWLAFAVIVALGFFVASALRAEGALRRARAEIAAENAALPGFLRCRVEGRVASSPTMRQRTVRVAIDPALLECEGHRKSDGSYRIALYVDGDAAPPLGRGDHITALAQLAPPERFANPELGDPWPRIARSQIVRSGGALAIERTSVSHGISSLVDRLRLHVRARIEATFAPPAAPLARALVLGESDLDPADDDAFRASGLSHLLAVSGMHLVLVVLTFERLVRTLLSAHPRWIGEYDVGRGSSALAIPAAWLYADFAGGSGSAIRAAWMLTFVLGARAFGRRTTGARALALSTFGGLLFEPLIAFDVSFALSLAATAGLLACSDRFGRFFGGGRIGKSLGVTLAASLPCAPLLAGLGPTLPLGGLVANVVAVPIGEMAALPLALIHALLSGFPAAERGCAWAASGALLLVRAVARGCASVPWLALPVPSPTPLQVALIYVALGSAVLLHGKRRLGALAACVVLLLVAERSVRRDGSPRDVVRATFIDVGQGDAMLLDLPNGEAMLIDAGGLVGSPIDVGERVIAPLLRARRRSALAAVVLSHPHPDHYGGLVSGLAAVRVDEFWDTGQGAFEGRPAHRAASAALALSGARTLGPKALCGAPREIAGVHIEVLAPCPTFDPDRGANDNSFVLRIAYGRRSFLLVGDAEEAAERDLIRDYGQPGPVPGVAGLASDVLKVGHHGSATSSSEAFLEAVRPSIAVISVGARNRFGHPQPSTLERLAHRGAIVHRTDTEGQIVVETDGERIRVTTAEGGSRFTP